MSFMESAAQVLLVAAQLFAILNPPSSIPAFLAITEREDTRARARLAKLTTWLVLALMLAFALTGNYLLAALDISLESLKLGGGLLLLALALDMVLGSRQEGQDGREEAGIVPVVTPLLVGPGTITTLVILSAYYPAPVLLAAVGVTAAAAYICLRFSDLIMRLLGRMGVSAFSRLMAVLIAAMACEMIHSALLAWGIAKA